MSAVMSAALFARLFPIGSRVRLDAWVRVGGRAEFSGYGRVVSDTSPALDRSVVTVRYRSAAHGGTMVELPVHVDGLAVKLYPTVSSHYTHVPYVLTLRRLFPIGSTVQTRMLHVSRSGMLRTFAVIALDYTRDSDHAVRDVSSMVADVMNGGKLHSNGGVPMGGCGQDMGFALAYSLSRALYAGEFLCTGDPSDRCPSNDHVNEWNTPDRGYSLNRLHSDAGYALTHRHL